jgi:hypothetical protein
MLRPMCLGFHDQGVEFFATFGNSIGSELALACTKSVPAISAVVVLNTMRGSTSEFYMAFTLWASFRSRSMKLRATAEATLYNELRLVEACENLDVLGKRRIPALLLQSR